MKERLKKELKRLAIIVSTGVIYLIFVSVTDIRIPCVFKVITGFDCPACGITRMFVSIAKMDFKTAFSYNSVIFVTLPLIIGCLAFERITYIINGQVSQNRVCKFLLWSEILVLIIYGVIRNIG